MLIPVVIIGAGPAGIMAAIQLTRSGIDFLLLEKNRIGGLLHEANWVENFPGIGGGITGKALAGRLKRQLNQMDIKTEKATVNRLAYHGKTFSIHTEKQAMRATKVILACGTLPIPPGPPLDHPLLRRRVYTSVLPLRNIRDKTIAVIGGGDAAFDYALNLAAKNQVHIMFRSAKPHALPLLIERCRRHHHITIHENSPLTDARTGTEADEIILETREQEIPCQLLLTAFGREPACHFMEPDLAAGGAGLQAQKRLFMVGDAANGRFRQAAIAAGDGLRAALEIYGGQPK
ncbi:MAG: NAD(P)/FAD-dependent oxidoreductase [Candidatus Aminicenantes bacterium]|nr:NAD(P)/FAD-dependent oxidoreductase [Candidatus Aminicenantes bacterium]